MPALVGSILRAKQCKIAHAKDDVYIFLHIILHDGIAEEITINFQTEDSSVSTFTHQKQDTSIEELMINDPNSST